MSSARLVTSRVGMGHLFAKQRLRAGHVSMSTWQQVSHGWPCRHSYITLGVTLPCRPTDGEAVRRQLAGYRRRAGMQRV